jgi:MFS family permease
MGPLASVVVLLNALGQMLSASLPVLAFDRYGDAKVGGWLFAAYGLGGLIGTLIAFQLVKRMEPLLGLVLAGFLLQHAGLMVTFTIIAAGVTVVCMIFVALLTRFRRREVLEAAAAPS